MIDERNFRALALTGFVEPHLFAGRKGSALTLRQQITYAMGQRLRLEELFAREQHRGALPGIGGQALSRRAQLALTASMPLVSRRRNGMA